MASCSVFASEMQVYIDDADVVQDTYYPGCFWKHCKKKAKKLKEHYLRDKIYSKLKKQKLSFTTSSTKSIKDGLKIKISMYLTGSGRGYSEFAVETLTLGTAPMKMDAWFNVEYEFYRGGELVKSEKHKFKEKRNISVLADTQKYKKKAASRIVKHVMAIIKDIRKT